MDSAEWDTLFAGRGAFLCSGPRAIEAAFGVPGEPEYAWWFHYWIVRASASWGVAATFFTTALWKDDMLSSSGWSTGTSRRTATARGRAEVQPPGADGASPLRTVRSAAGPPEVSSGVGEQRDDRYLDAALDVVRDPVPAGSGRPVRDQRVDDLVRDRRGRWCLTGDAVKSSLLDDRCGWTGKHPGRIPSTGSHWARTEGGSR
jgi:hypothetical protein